MKLANNFLSATAIVATAEAVVLGVKGGLDPATMLAVINASTGPQHRERGQVPAPGPERQLRRRLHDRLLTKDLGLCAAAAEALGVPMPVPPSATPSGSARSPSSAPMPTSPGSSRSSSRPRAQDRARDGRRLRVRVLAEPRYSSNGAKRLGARRGRVDQQQTCRRCPALGARRPGKSAFLVHQRAAHAILVEPSAERQLAVDRAEPK